MEVGRVCDRSLGREALPYFAMGNMRRLRTLRLGWQAKARVNGVSVVISRLLLDESRQRQAPLAELEPGCRPHTSFVKRE